MSVSESHAESGSAAGESRLGVLRHRHFRNVWCAALVSNTGNWMELVAIQMIVAQLTGSLSMMGYLGAASLVPVLALGLLGGVAADRFNRRTLLVITQFGLMVVAGLIFLVSWLGAPGIGRFVGMDNDLVACMFLLSAAQGVVVAFNMPAWQVLTPRLVPREELTKAITLNGVQFNLSRVLGPALGGWLLARVGPTPLFALNTLSFLVVLMAFVSTPDAPAPPRNGDHPWRQIGEASRFIFRSRGPLAIFAAMVLMSTFAAPLVRMLPLYVMDVYELKDAAAESCVGTLLALLGLGAVVGGIMLRYIPAWYPKHHFIPVSVAGAGLSITGFALTESALHGYIVMVICGVFWIWGFNQSWAAMQHLVPDAMRGRVMAIVNVACFGLMALGNLIAGWLGEWVAALAEDRALGSHLAVGSLSLLLFGAGLVMMIWRTPEVDGVEPGQAGYDRRPGLISGLTASAHRPRGKRAAVERAEPDQPPTDTLGA